MPNGQETRQLRQFVGSCRLVYNKALAINTQRYEKKEKRLGYAELSVLLPSWKREHPFLSDAPAQALQQSSMHAVVVNVGTNQSIENRQDVPAIFHHSRENIA